MKKFLLLFILLLLINFDAIYAQTESEIVAVVNGKKLPKRKSMILSSGKSRRFKNKSRFSGKPPSIITFSKQYWNRNLRKEESQ
jgi:hypothetical protein